MNNISPRKSLMAAIMSLILPGFGQLYNGQLNKGILLFICFTFVSLPLAVMAALYAPSSLMLPLIVIQLLLTIGLWLYGIIDAWKTAGLSAEYLQKQWQQPATYIGAFLMAMLILSVVTQYIRSHLVESFHIPSSSMEPSILQGDVLFADKRYNCPGCKHRAQRGDTAIFVYPNNRSLYFIKRIVGLPGDRVKIEDQMVYVNGQALTQEHEADGGSIFHTEQAGNTRYQVKWSKGDQAQMTEITVPAGSVFVLGDNRSKTKDSRKFGTVPLMDVVGKTRQIWFSKGKDGVRWDRLGKVVE